MLQRPAFEPDVALRKQVGVLAHRGQGQQVERVIGSSSPLNVLRQPAGARLTLARLQAGVCEIRSAATAASAN